MGWEKSYYWQRTSHGTDEEAEAAVDARNNADVDEDMVNSDTQNAIVSNGLTDDKGDAADREDLPTAQAVSSNAGMRSARVIPRAANTQGVRNEHIEEQCQCARIVPLSLRRDMKSKARGSLKNDFFVLKKVFDIKFDYFCDLHLLELGNQMGLKTANLIREQLVELLGWLHRERGNVKGIKTSPDTYNLFRDSERLPELWTECVPLHIIRDSEEKFQSQMLTSS